MKDLSQSFFFPFQSFAPFQSFKMTAASSKVPPVVSTAVEFYQDLVDKTPVVTELEGNPFAAIDEMLATAAAAAMEIPANGENSKKRALTECKNDQKPKKVALDDEDDLLLVDVSVSSNKDCGEMIESNHDDKVPPFAIVAANDEEIPAVVEDDASTLKDDLTLMDCPIVDHFEAELDSALDEEVPASSDDRVESDVVDV